MRSLKSFHVVFILLAIIITDMFGAWGVWQYSQTDDTAALVWGIVSFAAGFLLIVYAVWFVRKLDRARIE